MYWKDRETCSQIRSSPDKYLDELPFQESKPLAPSEKEEDSTTRNHSTTLEVFLVRIAEIQEIDNKVVECIDLDNYNMDDNGYFSNIPKEGGATTEGGTSDMGRPLLTDDIPRVSVMVKLEDNTLYTIQRGEGALGVIELPPERHVPWQEEPDASRGIGDSCLRALQVMPRLRVGSLGPSCQDLHRLAGLRAPQGSAGLLSTGRCRWSLRFISPLAEAV